MGRVKEFGYFLASCVYMYGLSEEEIIEITSIQYGVESSLDYSLWLQRQVQYIKRNPEVFKDVQLNGLHTVEIQEVLTTRCVDID